MGLFKKSLKVAEEGVKLVTKVLPDTQATRDLKGEIIKAEVNSDSKFLKNASPSVIYLGLILILLEDLGLRDFLLNLYYTVV